MIKDQVYDKLKDKVTDWVQKNQKRISFTLKDNADLKPITENFYRNMGLRFITASGVDNEKNFEILYHFSFDKSGEIFTMRLFLEGEPEVDSLTSVFEAASWIEREIHEMLGINFKGHPNLKHLLLREDWPEGKCPLRKDYKDE